MNKNIAIPGLIILSMMTGALLYHFKNRQQQKLQTTTTSAGAASKGIVIGSARPDFELPDSSHTLHKMSEWDGKVVLVNFWATWCPPCRAEMPEFIELKEQYASEGFEVLGIAMDTAELATEFAKDIGVNYPILFTDMTSDKLPLAFGNFGGYLPYSALVDRTGTIRFVQGGLLEKSVLEEQLQKLL